MRRRIAAMAAASLLALGLIAWGASTLAEPDDSTPRDHRPTEFVPTQQPGVITTPDGTMPTETPTPAGGSGTPEVPPGAGWTPQV